MANKNGEQNPRQSWLSMISVFRHSSGSSYQNPWLGIAGIALVYAVVQILLATGNLSSLMQGLLVPLCIYGILAVSLNLTVGILGELSLGHAGFMCVGAFSSAFFSKLVQDSLPSAWIRFPIAILLGMAMAGISGILIGIPVLRLREDYLDIVTLAFGEIIKNIMNILYVGKDSRGLHFSMNNVMEMGLEADGIVLIKGAQGITGAPQDSSFTIGVLMLILTLVIVLNLVNSRSGRAIMAIRDNIIAAQSLGIPVTRFKLLAFSLSAALAGGAGALYAHNLSTLSATPGNFGYNMSIMILVFVVLGGIGNIQGSIVAAALLTLLPELLRGLNNYRMLIYAVVLILLMLYNWAPAWVKWRKEHRIFARAKK